MKKNALVIGATGATGQELVSLLGESEYYERVLVVHRRKTGLDTLNKVVEIELDFDELPGSLLPGFEIHDVFCALGTTIKKAKSKEAFRKVDFNYVTAMARWSRDNRVRSFTVISSIGAKASSSFLYPKTKGQMEKEVAENGPSQVNIMQPSFLEAPNRNEKRLGEVLALSLMKFFTKITPWLTGNYRHTHVKVLAAVMVQAAQQTHVGVNTFTTKQIHKLARNKLR